MTLKTSYLRDYMILSEIAHISVESNMAGGSHLGFVDYRTLQSKYEFHHRTQHGRKPPFRHITGPFKSIYLALTHLPQFHSKLGLWAPMSQSLVTVFIIILVFSSPRPLPCINKKFLNSDGHQVAFVFKNRLICLLRYNAQLIDLEPVRKS